MFWKSTGEGGGGFELIASEVLQLSASNSVPGIPQPKPVVPAMAQTVQDIFPVVVKGA